MNAETFCEQFATFAEAPNGIEKLRELILQLAVQGQLVPQNEQDEPASVLRSKIQANRKRLIESGDFNAFATDSEWPEGALPHALPVNWEWIRLGELGGFLGGGTPSKERSEYWDGEIPWVSPKDMKRPYIDNAIDHVSPLGVANSSGKMIPSGSLLMVVRGMILAHSFPVALSMRPLTINQDMKALQLALPELGEYLLRCCAGIKTRMLGKVERSSHGTCRLPTEAVANFPIPLPPLAEQKRIVAKVDQLLGLCDELAARQAARREARERLVGATLDRLVSAPSPAEFPKHAHRLRDNFDRLFDTPTTIPQLRQAILQLAIQGRLVPQDPNNELAESEETPLADLLSEDSLNGYSKAPSNSPGGIPILRISAGTSRRDFIVDETDYKWVPDTGSVEKFVLRPNDLLACRFNGNLHFVGRFSLYVGTSGQKQINPDKLIRFRVNQRRCDPHYVCFAMNARQTRDKIEAFCATTAGNIGISASNLKTVTIRVPPLDEQKRIVSKVTELLSLCEVLEAKLAQSESVSSELLSAAVSQLLRPTG